MMATLVVCLGISVVSPAAAQRVEFDRASVDRRSTEIIEEILERDNALVLVRDTVLPAEFSTSGDLLIVSAAIRLEGTVSGSVGVLGGELFIRPGSRIDGVIAVAGGAVYGSGLAEYGEIISLPVSYRLTVDELDDVYLATILPPPPPPLFRLDGPVGLGIPTYDRVNGLTIRGGIRLDLARYRDETDIRLIGQYSTARGAPGGRITGRTPLTETVWLGADAGRRTFTNDDWIRGDLENSISSLFLAADARDYYESDYIEVALERRHRTGLLEGESFWGPFVRVHLSEDRSLRARSAWSAFGDFRENPPIAEATVASVTGGSSFSWRGRTTGFDGEALIEYAPGSLGDLEFSRWAASGRWTAVALWRHTLEVRARGAGSVGSDPVPPQRWYILGAGGTLPTLDRAHFRGDRMAFVESTYLAPIRGIQLPWIGMPTLMLRHAVGAAWRTGEERPPFEQNIGLGAHFSIFEVAAYSNPADDPWDLVIAFAGRFPF